MSCLSTQKDSKFLFLGSASSQLFSVEVFLADLVLIFTFYISRKKKQKVLQDENRKIGGQQAHQQARQ